jgi:UDPglucose--hexose-1-phosphate uridylyltransferase
MSTHFDPAEHPHRRLNPMTGEWNVVSPHRMKRPWQGKVEVPMPEVRPAYDPSCYLCPGNARAGGAQNPRYDHTFVFTNDFAGLLPDAPLGTYAPHPLTVAKSEQGTCRVMCFSPRHDLTLAEMEVPDIEKVVSMWAQQTAELGRSHRWVQIFENKGEIMGCSNPHPHGQIWAVSSLPNEPVKEDRHQRRYAEEHGRVMLIDCAGLEVGGERVIVENDSWLVVVPFWALWPFETLILPKRHVLRLPDLSEPERQDLAKALKRVLTRYDNLFHTSFPYSMGWHGAPFQEGDCGHWQLHAHFYPPLLRSATVKKFMVGYEMLGEPQRDLTPEQAAARLREVPEVHYKREAK